MKSAWDSVEDFEQAISEYTGAPYVTCVDGCTAAIRLCLKWHKMNRGPKEITIPIKTYPAVPMTIKEMGYDVNFHDFGWPSWGGYHLIDTDIYDCARWFNKYMYRAGTQMCVSFHPEKPFGLPEGGGAILYDNAMADKFFKEIRFHARKKGIPTCRDEYTYHEYMDDCRMWPPTAVAGLLELAVYARTDHPPMLEGIEDYPDCSKLFGGKDAAGS
jgi:dTDP-4-amino-4,6-dideoxygalactose transaminase